MITITDTQDKASTELLLTVSKRIFNTGRPLLCLLFSAILTLLLVVTAGKSDEGRILLIFSFLITLLFASISIMNVRTLPALRKSIATNEGKTTSLILNDDKSLILADKKIASIKSLSQYWMNDYYIIMQRTPENKSMYLFNINADTFDDIFQIASHLQSKGCKLIRLKTR